MRHSFFISVIIFLLISTNTFSQWTLQNSGFTNGLRSVDFLTEYYGWIAGPNDIIKQSFDGGDSWFGYSGGWWPIDRYWYSIACVNENTVYACGTRFMDWYEAWYTYTTDGGNYWFNPSGSFTPNTSSWMDVFFLNENIGWKVGYRNGSGKISKTTSGVGGAFGTIATVPEPLYSIMFTDENYGWTVGTGGAIYHSIYGGSAGSWSSQNSGTTKDLNSIYFINSNIGWCVGDYNNQAIILKTVNGGQAWTSTFPSNITKLNSVYFINENTGWACGSVFSTPNDDGVILYTDNGGDTWSVQHVENSCSELYDIDFANNITGWAVGTHGVILKYKSEEDDLAFITLEDMIIAKYSAGYTSTENYIYSICGGLGEAPWKSTSIEKYDIAFNFWTEIVTGLIPRRYCSAEYVSSQNKIYIFNGDTYTNYTYTDTVEIVDVQTGTLSYSATNPYPVEYGGSAVWNDKIYLFGGSNSSGNSNRLYEFDPSTNNWTRLPDMSEAKQTNGEIVNGVLYVFGGYSGSTSSRIDAYNIQNSSWTYLGDMPVGISAHATAKSGNNIFIVGSYDDIKFLAIYNTETNNLTQLSSNMIGRRHAGARVIDNDLYIFGGNQVSGNYSTILKSLQCSDISELVNAVDDYKDNRAILSYNYPNPFNPSTTISFSIPEESKIELIIYNIKGQHIKSLIKNYFQKGNHSIVWDGKDANGKQVSSGVYFYKLITNTKEYQKKMLLMK